MALSPYGPNNDVMLNTGDPNDPSNPAYNNTGINGGGSPIPSQTYGPSPAVTNQPLATHDFDPNTGLSREAWRDQFMGLGSISPQAADEWLRSHGGNQLGGKGDVWQTPYGDTLDLQIGRGAANANGGNIMPAWTQTNAPGQSNGSSFNPSIMQNGGADFAQLLASLFGQNPYGNQAHLMGQSAMPYNPHANQQQGISNYFGNQNQNNQMQTSGQTDGTLLGTKMSSVPSNFQPGTAQNDSFNGRQQSQTNDMFAKPQYSWLTGKAPSMENNPMGSPSFFNQQKDTQTSTKPLPDNNMMIG